MTIVPLNESASAEDQSPRPWQRNLVFAIALLAIVHTILIAAWLAPSSPVRTKIGDTRLASYVDPYFQQGWSALDPNAQHVDEKLLIRAEILHVASRKSTVTGWFDVTAAEDNALLHSLAPARVHLINRRLATNLNATTFALTTVQRRLIAKDYVKKSILEYSGKLNAAGSVPAVVTNYLSYDKMVTQFASMYAAAKWHGEVLKIQYKAGRYTVPEFKNRRTSPPKFVYFSYGWRKPIPGQQDAQAAFDSYLKK